MTDWEEKGKIMKEKRSLKNNESIKNIFIDDDMTRTKRIAEKAKGDSKTEKTTGQRGESGIWKQTKTEKKIEDSKMLTLKIWIVNEGHFDDSKVQHYKLQKKLQI